MNPQHKPYKILLIGDSCIDEYHFGTVERLSPEAPVPILKNGEIISKPGMSGNVEANLMSIGLDVVHMTNTNKPRKVRYIDKVSGQHLLRVDYNDTVEPLKNIPFDPDASAVVISDYCKGYLSYEIMESIISCHIDLDIPVFIDTKKHDLQRFEGAFVKINSHEYKAATSHCSDLIVTMGGDGARYRATDYPAEKVEVFDVCGAGDTFLSALTYKYLETKNIDESIMFANKASAISVQHSGVYVLTRDDIRRIDSTQ